MQITSKRRPSSSPLCFCSRRVIMIIVIIITTIASVDFGEREICVESALPRAREGPLSRIYIWSTAFHYACTSVARTVTHFGNQEPAALFIGRANSSFSFQVNGKDVANKEQTENLFAETKNAVTILVSRCLYQVCSHFTYYCRASK